MQRAVGRRQASGGCTDRSADGFTIIEVMFFLAISSALLVALLATVGFSVSRQRFTDSGLSLQAFFQSQYSDTLNVINDREGSSTCDLPGGGGASTRGASDCVILGKAIDLTTGSPTLTTYDVLGVEPTDPGNATGAGLLALYNPALDQSSKSTYDIPWDAPVYGATPAGTSRILLLRSPDSGLVLSFGGGNGANLTSLINANAQTYNVCIQSADITSSVTAISLSPTAGSEGVTTQPNLSDTDKGKLC